MLAALSDVCLVAEVRAGNQAAYGELVHRYRGKLHTIVLGMVPNQEDARDLLQEVFIKAYRGLRHFCGDASFYTWLYRIAVNTCIDFRRNSRRSLAPISLADEALTELGYEPADTRASADPYRSAARRELAAHVTQAIQELSEPFRVAVWLHDIEGYTQKQIAEALQCPLGTVKTRIHRGRVELRHRLAPFIEEPRPERV